MRTAIVGAGMTGLIAALRLLERGDSVTIFERASVAGGLASGFVPAPECASLERFYHHIFASDRHVIDLCAEVGLRDRLYFSRPATACLHGGTSYRVDSLSAILRFTPLSGAQRLRLIGALALLKLVPNSALLEGRRAAAWLRSVAGAEAYRVVFEPLFRGKFGAAAERVSLGWFWARIHDRTASLGYIRGGFAPLYETLVARIRERGGCVAFGCRVVAIAPVRGCVEIGIADAPQPAIFDRVVATLALPRLAALCTALPASFVATYSPEPGLAARCLVLALDRPLTGTYWTNVCEADWPFVVIVEHTALAAPEQYGGRHIVYVGNYAPAFERVSARTLAAQFEPYLRRLNPAFDASWICDAWQFVASEAQPIVTPGYRSRIAPHNTPVPGLYVANLAQVYPHDRGQNYAIELAETLVKALSAANTGSADP